MSQLIKILRGIRLKNKYRHNERDANVWVFGEWFGERCSDNCMYFANYVARHYPHYNLYWVTKDGVDCSGLDEGITLLPYGSQYAIEIFARAGAVFMNQGFRDFTEEGFNYFDGAVTMNLWHGVMWKYIGHDGAKHEGLLYRAYVRLFDKAFSPNAFLATSEEYARICGTAFGANDAQIVRAGLPRNKLFYDLAEMRFARNRVLGDLKVRTKREWDSNTKIITYMPTFRDNTDEVFSFERLIQEEHFRSWLEEENAVIIQKTHFVDNRRGHKEPSGAYERLVLLGDYASQVLLAATDVLVTDYSSCFFDYLLLDKPIIHFLYDYDYYAESDRGLYYNIDEVVCGRVAYTANEVFKLLKDSIKNPRKDHGLRQARIEKYMTYESPSSCETIYRETRKKVMSMVSEGKPIKTRCER